MFIDPPKISNAPEALGKNKEKGGENVDKNAVINTQKIRRSTKKVTGKYITILCTDDKLLSASVTRVVFHF